VPKVREVTEKKTREPRERSTKVVLHRLAGTKKALEACRLVERLYRAGKRVTVLLSDTGRASMFDEYLWTFAQHSFVPHALWDGRSEVEDPVVVITGTVANPNAATVLVIGDRISDSQEAAAFPEVHDFVTTSPEDEGKKKTWEDAGFRVEERRGAAGREPA
jgi:DNA polymerase-3 subunit chi